MPSEADARSTIADYFCELVDQGRVEPQVKQLIRAESSQLICAPLGEPNFVCGGEMRFIGTRNDIDAVAFSPTMRREEDGRFAIYEGEGAEGEEVWRVPASRITSKACTSR